MTVWGYSKKTNNTVKPPPKIFNVEKLKMQNCPKRVWFGLVWFDLLNAVAQLRCHRRRHRHRHHRRYCDCRDYRD